MSSSSMAHFAAGGGVEPHLARHGVQVQRDHVHYAGGGASSIMLLAMLLLGLMKKCAWNILREVLVCCS